MKNKSYRLAISCTTWIMMILGTVDKTSTAWSQISVVEEARCTLNRNVGPAFTGFCAGPITSNGAVKLPDVVRFAVDGKCSSPGAGNCRIHTQRRIRLPFSGPLRFYCKAGGLSYTFSGGLDNPPSYPGYIYAMGSAGSDYGSVGGAVSIDCNGLVQKSGPDSWSGLCL